MPQGSLPGAPPRSAGHPLWLLGLCAGFLSGVSVLLSARLTTAPPAPQPWVSAASPSLRAQLLSRTLRASSLCALEAPLRGKQQHGAWVSRGGGAVPGILQRYPGWVGFRARLPTSLPPVILGALSQSVASVCLRFCRVQSGNAFLPEIS